MAELKMKVSVEKAIHSSLQDILQKIWDEFGVRVDDLSADWIDVSSPVEPEMRLTGINMRTTTKV